MGKILQIQVRAYTYDENEVIKAYPELVKLVWPDYYRKQIADKYIKHGVIELAYALDNEYHFSSWDSELKNQTKDLIATIISITKKLEEHLANWQAKEANQSSYELEDNFKNLEQIVKTYNYNIGK